jgi:hypothetical protein
MNIAFSFPKLTPFYGGSFQKSSKEKQQQASLLF